MPLTEVDVARLNDDVFAATGTNKNRIINGDMRIDQRNAGASVSLNGSNSFPVDRFKVFGRVAGGATAQRSTTAPADFTNSLLYTVTTGATPDSGDYPAIIHAVEGFNIGDLNWGTANAKSVTLSFWVRSSITGTYALSLRNSASARSYVAQYTINSANTFEYKTITIPGDTSGTWLTNNGLGIEIAWDMGLGFGNTTTPNTWLATNSYRVSSNVQLAATTGATFYLTGIQLEAGDTATPFERRNYGQELALCQRYCPVFDASISFNGTAAPVGSAYASSTTSGTCIFSLPVQTRVPPTGITVSAGNHFAFSNGVGSFSGGSLTFSYGSCNAVSIGLSASSGSVTASTGGYLYALNSAGKIIFNGCEL